MKKLKITSIIFKGELVKFVELQNWNPSLYYMDIKYD